MNCFQLIKIVLDEVYFKIPCQDEMKKDKLIAKRLVLLAKSYRNLLSPHPPIDYSDPITRFAYIYKYVPFHANIIYSIISRSEELQELFQHSQIKTTCIGGGPGSDLLGILKYCMEINQSKRLSFILFDREEAWAESWEDIGDKLDSDLRINSSFQRLDIIDEKSWSEKSKYLNSNLYTMMYFLSEVYALKDESSKFFNHLFAEIPENSIVLFIDNNSDEFLDWFDDLCKSSLLVPIQSKCCLMRLEDSEEQKTDLGIYYQKFGKIENCRPKLTANIGYRICKKIAT